MTPTLDLATALDHLATLRSKLAQTPREMLDAIVRFVGPELGDAVRDIIAEYQDLEAEYTNRATALEQAIRAEVLATGAYGEGTTLQAVPMAGRVTWNTKELQVYARFHPEILEYRKVGEPSVTIRAIPAQRH